jgi:O-antigen/teichoic acid export membrane protein
VKTPKVASDQAFSEEAGSDVTTVAKGGAVQLTGLITQRTLSLGFIALAVRLLGAAGYGVYRQVYQILQIGSMLAPGGFQWAAVRFIARARALGEHGKVRGTSRVALIGAGTVGTLLFAALFLGARPLANALEETVSGRAQLAFLLRLGAAFIPLYAITSVLRNVTQAYKTMVPSVLVDNIIQPVAFILISVGALLLGFGVTGAVWGLPVSAGVGLLAAIWYYHRMLTPKEREARPVSEVGPIFRFALPQAGVNLFSIQALGLGVIILGLFRSDREVGLFAIALSVQTMATVFLSGIVNIWAPVVSELYSRGEIARLASLYKTINRWVATFSLPIFALLIIEPHLITRVFAGKSGIGAASLVALLAIGNIVFVASGPSGILMSMSGRPGITFINSVIAVALYLGFGIWLVPAYGAVGMALVDSGVTIVTNVARVVQARIFVGIHPYGRSFAKPVVATVLGVLTLLAWKHFLQPGMLLEVVGIAVAGIVYLGALQLMGISPEERYVFDRIRSRVFKTRSAIEG